MLEIASAPHDPAPTKVMATIMRAEIDLNINIEMPLYRSKKFCSDRANPLLRHTNIE
jgi:hypothetical protein